MSTPGLELSNALRTEMDLPDSHLKIVRAECGDDTVVLGAAHLAFCANGDTR